MNSGQSIIMAYYHNNELKGFYSDSDGTCTQIAPKIYIFTDQHLPIIEKNIEKRLVSLRKHIVKDPQLDLDEPMRKTQEVNGLYGINKLYNEWGDFELRVFVSPDYVAPDWMYPVNEIDSLILDIRQGKAEPENILKFKL